MLSRAVWAVGLALLGWIPVGRGGAWAIRGDFHDRVIVSHSALEIAADSPARTASAFDARPDQSAQKRPEPPRSLQPVVGALQGVSPISANGRQSELRQERLPWRVFRAKRLTVPHDAIAPPSSES